MQDDYIVTASGGGWLTPSHEPTSDFLRAGMWPKAMAMSMAAEKSKRLAVPVVQEYERWLAEHAPTDPTNTVYGWITGATK